MLNTLSTDISLAAFGPFITAFLGAILGPVLVQSLSHARSKKQEVRDRKRTELGALEAHALGARDAAIDYWSSEKNGKNDTSAVIAEGHVRAELHACAETVVRIFSTPKLRNRSEVSESRDECEKNLGILIEACTGGQFMAATHQKDPDRIRNIIVSHQLFIQKTRERHEDYQDMLS